MVELESPSASTSSHQCKRAEQLPFMALSGSSSPEITVFSSHTLISCACQKVSRFCLFAKLPTSFPLLSTVHPLSLMVSISRALLCPSCSSSKCVYLRARGSVVLPGRANPLLSFLSPAVSTFSKTFFFSELSFLDLQIAPLQMWWNLVRRFSYLSVTSIEYRLILHLCCIPVSLRKNHRHAVHMYMFYIP